jgi:parallel beta-helix repeat protein
MRKLKKWLTFLLTITMILSSIAGFPLRVPSVKASGEPTLGVIFSRKISSTVTVDGHLNEAFWNLSNAAGKVITGNPNNTVTFGTAWDNTNLYIGVKVLDSLLSPANHGNELYQDDTIEIYLDGGNEKANTYDSNDHQIFIRYIDKSILTSRGGTATNFKDNLTFGVQDIDGGYTVELQVPWSSLGVTPKEGVRIGFDVQNDDNDSIDGQGLRESVLLWHGADNNWNNPSKFGELFLTGKQDPVIANKATPVVDGDLEAGKWNLNKSLSISPSCNLTFGALADAQYLYIGAKVLDGDLVATPAGGAVHDFDSVELYFDGDNSKGTTYGSGDTQLRVSWKAEDFVIADSNGVKRALKNIEGGYTIEVAVPWSVLGISPKFGSSIGFDIAVKDRRSDGSNNWKVWNGTGNNWKDTSQFGNLMINHDFEKDSEGESNYDGPRATYIDDAEVLPAVKDPKKEVIIDHNNISLRPAGTWGDGTNGYISWVLWSESNQSYVTYKSPNGDILNLEVKTIETATPSIFEFQVSNDGVNYTKINPTVTTERIAGWIDINTYKANFKNPVKYVKILFKQTVKENDWRFYVSSVKFDYKNDNRAPVSEPVNYRIMTENSILSGNMRASDPDGDDLTYSIKTQGENGTVSIEDSSSNAWTYTPKENFIGFDTFVVQAQDTHGQAVSTKVNVQVNYAASNLTYYVSADNGSDSNDGLSEAAAFKTIKNAHSVSRPGDTILIMNGRYDEGEIRISRSGLPGEYITYKNFPGHKPVINPYITWNAILVTGSYIILDGLTVEGNKEKVTYEEAMAVYELLSSGQPVNWAAEVTGYTNQNGIAIRADRRIPEPQHFPHHVEVRNCEVFNNSGSGINVEMADYIIIENNTVYGNCNWDSYATSGISIFHSVDWDDNTTDYKNIVRNNISYNNEHFIPWILPKKLSDGNGIIIDDNKNAQHAHPYEYKGKTLVENNIVFNNGAAGINVFESANVDVFNNTSFNNNKTEGINYGEIGSAKCDNVRIMNNIMVARTGKHINQGGLSNNRVYDYNIYFNGTPTFKGANDIIADPKFVDPTKGDFRLQADSPALDSGLVSVAPARDFYGVSRPQGSGIDRGAIERASNMDLTKEIIGYINTLNVNKVTENLLLNKLDGVLKFLEKRQEKEAMNKLRVFKQHIETAQKFGLTTEQASKLSKDSAVIERLIKLEIREN